MNNTVKTLLTDIEPMNIKFKGTIVEQWSLLPATSKGTKGEEVAEAILTGLGRTVKNRESKEHDRIIDGKKVEIKTAFEKKCSEKFSIYGYDPVEDPHYWIYQLVSTSGIYLFSMDRQQMANVYLAKSRKNVMFTTTLAEMKRIATEVAHVELT